MKIEDRRTEEEKANTWAFVVCNDSFLSGWGLARGGRSLYALAVTSPAQAKIVLDNGRARSDMRRVRLNMRLPRLREGDHLVIVGPSDAPRWYEPGGFRIKEED